MLFCAGLGTRLRPLTGHTPKPAVPFLGRPLVAHTLDWLRAAGVTHVVVNLHHLADTMRRVVLEHAHGLELAFSLESELLGTGGGLVAARPLLGPAPPHDPILVVNGDSYLDVPPAAVAELHAAHRGVATLWLSRDPRHAEIANVRVRPEPPSQLQVIAAIAGRPVGASGEPAAYLGLQLVDDLLLDRLPPSGPSCIRDQGWIPALEAGHRLGAALLGGAAFDLGTPERYLAAHRELSGGAALDAAVAEALRVPRS